MVHFAVHNNNSVVSCQTAEEAKLVAETAQIKIEYYARARGAKHPDKFCKQQVYFERLATPGGCYATYKVPTGIIWRIRDALKQAGHICKKRDLRGGIQRPAPHLQIELPTPPTGAADYGFQGDAVKCALRHGRGLLWYPTGSGKTVIMARIIAAVKARALVMVPSKQLIQQTYRKFCAYFGPDNVGWCGEGERNFEPSIVVGTQQSLNFILKNDPETFDRHIRNSFDMLFIDECHHVNVNSTAKRRNKKTGQWEHVAPTANTWHKVASEIDCYHKFGMTATLNSKTSPNNHFVLETVTGPVISSITVSELIRRNVLCGVDAVMFKHPCKKYGVWSTVNTYKKVDGVKMPRVKYAGARERSIIENSSRNAMVAEAANTLAAMGRRVLVVVEFVEKHGNELVKLMPNAVYLHGKHTPRQREAGIQEALRNKRPLVSTIFSEGFDLPALDALVIAGAGKSENNLKQKIGRVLRVAEDKGRAIVVDFYDDDAGSMCARHSDNRLRVYRSEEEYTVRVIEKSNQTVVREVLERALNAQA